MSEKDRSERFYAAFPTFPVRNVPEAISAYREKFGFEPSFTMGDPPHFAIVKRGDVELHLKLEKDGAPAGSGTCVIRVRNLEAIYHEWKWNDAELEGDIVSDSQGRTAFTAHDEDGNTLIVMEQR